jgi:uncharacterized membrane protein
MILKELKHRFIRYEVKNYRRNYMTLKEILSENTDEIIAIAVVIPTIAVMGYQAIAGVDITMPTEPAMLILGYFFGKKMVTSE